MTTSPSPAPSPSGSPSGSPGARSDVRELARSGSITFAGGIGGAVCTFLLLVVLARVVGSTSTGLFFQAVAAVSTCAIAAAWGAGTTLTPRAARLLAHDRADLGELAWASIAPVLVVAVAMAALIEALHGPLAAAMTGSAADRHDLGLTLVATAPAIPLIVLTRLLTALARGVGAIGPTALYDAGGQPLLRLALCWLVAAAGGALWAIGLAFTAAAGVSVVGAAWHTLRSVRGVGAGLRRPDAWPRAEARAFWGYSLPRGLEELFQATNIWLLVVLVGALASPAEAATYSAVSRFTLASTLLMQAITTGMATRLTTALARAEHDRVRTLFQSSVTWTVGLSIPVAVTMWVFPSALIELVSPQLPGADLGLRVMALATLANVVTGPSGAVILFAGRSSWNLWIALPAVALMLTVAVLAVPAHGADGASYAWAAAIGLQSILGYVVTRRAFGLDPFTLPTLRLGGWSALLTLPAEVVAQLILGDRVMGLVVGVAAGAALYLGGNALTSWRMWVRVPV
ncbi:MAG TPA: lipopolysaccharide biosynthesis protein [Nocardioides sp.]|uniref:lipopolysaccharide biosynthesis protein n=1 Tax=Nocardioides sp. TaxID=35761 RepID=UPI002E339F70|nr:lipopolysaccharide biosynthesis protein [Nocardioides sp.]HEX3932292.1 lipopolysaccharide biosynthesis protein [Nocardioides sp.]